jgi:IclR family pca regulon transcriptional regulator
MPASESARNPEFVQSLERGLAVIRAFGPRREDMTLSEVAREAGLTRAAARRFLLTLVALGYVRSDGRKFSLRPRVLELGYSYLSGMTLPEVAQYHMEELVSRVHESSSVSVLDGTDVVYIVRVPTQRIMTIAIAVGTRFPAYATSMGRVLLAACNEEELGQYLSGARFEAFTRRTVVKRDQFLEILASVRAQGYAAVDQELEDGLRSVAVPLRDASGAALAAINISAHAPRVSMEALIDQILPQLRETARQIEVDLAAQRAGSRLTNRSGGRLQP